jgi:DNA polymerase-3 subunit alpha
LDGAAKISSYVKKAKENGMTSLALTDHGNMYGALRFYDACKKEDINPIVGCEFYCNPAGHTERPRLGKDDTHRYHLILLAMNEKGYHNLMELNSISWTEGYYYKPRIDDELLKEHNEGLICLSACLGGEILQLLLAGDYDRAKERALWFSSVFDDGRYFLELQDHGLEEQKRTNPLLVQISKETGIPVVATNDIHYIDKEDWEAQDVLLCIGTNSKVSEDNRMKFPSKEFYFKTPQQMEELFSWCPEAIANTAKIAERCHIEIHFPGPLLPIFKVPEGFKDTADYLRSLAHDGIKRRYKDIPQEYYDRLEYELNIIITMDFQGYFLIVRDYIYWAKTHGIPVGPGRGSGAGSIVAYCIDITDVDPMKYKLLFERFLNPDRVSMPDFDIDFCFERRSEVIDYVTQHYGKDHVAQIATFGTLKAKAVIKDCARALDIPFDEANKIAKFIPDEPKMTIAKALEMSPELTALRQQGGIYETLFDVASRLEGMNRHVSTHAAGVVIGQTPLINYVPLCSDSKTGAISTQYTMDLIEQCGLVKMDFLGLKTLTLLKHCVDLIHKRNPDFDLKAISDEDQQTFDMLRKGDSTCVFQFESVGMQKILRDAAPSNMEDLVALNALYRPGPMAYIPQFIECKHGRQQITYADPSLEDELKTTYGVIVYQEQVMKVAQIIAGYTLGQADILRRIMGKKKVYALAEEKVKFIAGAAKKGHSKEHAIEIFEMLEPFAGYGFNKSHAVAYSIIAYQTAYLKANYPAEFMAANLTNEINNPDKYSEYLAVCKEMGIKVLPPTINYSENQFTVVDNQIIYGLSGIKNVGEGAVQQIVEEREKNGPYKDFMDFLMRSSSKVLNSKLIESLICAGVFDKLGVNRPTLLTNLPEMLKFVAKSHEDNQYGQLSLFGEEETEEINQFNMVPVPDWKIMEKLEKEKELLGFYISGHPMDVYADAIKKSVVVNLGEPTKLPFGRTVSIIAMIQSVKQYTSKKNNKRMGFLTLVDKNGTIDATIFSDGWERYKDLLAADSIHGFTGKFDNKRGMDKISFLIDEVVDPSQLPPVALKNCFIKVNQTIAQSNMDYLTQLRDLLVTHADGNGTIQVDLLFQKDNSSARIEDETYTEEDEQQESPTEETKIICGPEFSISYNEGFSQEAKQIPVVTDVWFN